MLFTELPRWACVTNSTYEMPHFLSFHGHLHDLLRLNRLLNHSSHFAFTLRQATFQRLPSPVNLPSPYSLLTLAV